MARLHITSKSGKVRVLAEPGRAFAVSGAEVFEEPDGTRRVKGKSRTLEVQCPEGTDLVIGTASGSVEVRGSAGAVKVSCASGSIEVEHVHELDARTSSGSVTVGACDGECRVVCASGRVRVGAAGRAAIAAVSGSIHAHDVAAGDLKSVSGTVEVDARGGGRIGVKTVSGMVKVSVPRDDAPDVKLKSLTGHIRCDCDRGHDYEIAVGTVSGAIEVTCR